MQSRRPHYRLDRFRISPHATRRIKESRSILNPESTTGVDKLDVVPVRPQLGNEGTHTPQRLGKGLRLPYLRTDVHAHPGRLKRRKRASAAVNRPRLLDRHPKLV